MDIVSGVVCFGILSAATGEVLGAVGAGAHDGLSETEVFISLLPSARGQGYATEATRAVTAWALAHSELPYLIATVAVDNLPSQRAVERCGFEFIDERMLTVHLTGERQAFRYYRYYR